MSKNGDASDEQRPEKTEETPGERIALALERIAGALEYQTLCQAERAHPARCNHVGCQAPAQRFTLSYDRLVNMPVCAEHSATDPENRIPRPKVPPGTRQVDQREG